MFLFISSTNSGGPFCVVFCLFLHCCVHLVPATVYRGHLLPVVRPGHDGQWNIWVKRHSGPACAEGLQTDLHHQTSGLAHRQPGSAHT